MQQFNYSFDVYEWKDMSTTVLHRTHKLPDDSSRYFLHRLHNEHSIFFNSTFGVVNFGFFKSVTLDT